MSSRRSVRGVRGTGQRPLSFGHASLSAHVTPFRGIGSACLKQKGRADRRHLSSAARPSSQGGRPAAFRPRIVMGLAFSVEAIVLTLSHYPDIYHSPITCQALPLAFLQTF